MKIKSWYNSSSFSCKSFAQRMSARCDKNLNLKEKVLYWLHYYMCFTCRRVSAQVTKIESQLPKLCSCKKVSELQLSDEAKCRIKSQLDTACKDPKLAP